MATQSKSEQGPLAGLQALLARNLAGIAANLQACQRALAAPQPGPGPLSPLLAVSRRSS